MRRTALFAAAILATPACAQEFQPEFYVGILGGLSPTYSTDALLWPDDNHLLSAGAFGGFNLLSGAMLYGMELSVSRDFGRISFGEYQNPSYVQPYPRYTGSGYVSGTPQPARTELGSRPGGQASSATFTYSFAEVQARPSVSGRIGITHQNWTFYGKAGIGATLYSLTNVTDDSASVFCAETATETQWYPNGPSGNSYQTTETGCIGPIPGPVTSKSSSQWAPNIIYGLGVEYEFDRFFARSEVEVTQAATGSFNGTTRANAGLGIKF